MGQFAEMPQNFDTIAAGIIDARNRVVLSALFHRWLRLMAMLFCERPQNR